MKSQIGKPGVNYYSLLGVQSTATPEEITRGFRKKILQCHLDKMGPENDTELCYLTIEAHRILSDKALRQRYDVERSSSKNYKDSKEKFIPAGYICYDVGDQQMSRQILDSISGWSNEYNNWKDDLSDNYFDCFSQMVDKIIKDNDPIMKTDFDNERKLGSAYYHCDTCDKSFLTETHHWDSVINPYRGMFYSDKLGIGALMSYFENLIGQETFNWEVRYLPNRLLGIWGASEWSLFPSVKNEANRILKQCKYRPAMSRSSSSASMSSSSSSASSSPEPPSINDVIAKLENLLEKSATKRSNASFISAQNSFLRRSLLQNLIWVMENKEDGLEPITTRMNELMMQDDLQEILCLGVSIRGILGFEKDEWEQLIQEALSHEHFELAMIWTMLACLSGDKSKGDWFQLGMTLRGMGDAVLAHFCFLLAGCDTPAAWEELANIFTKNGLHHAACEYHLSKGNLFQLLHKSKAQEIDLESSRIYSGIYYATRLKGLLQILRNRPRQCSSDTNTQFDAEIEEIIEIIQDLGGNLLEGFRIIVSTWPDIFEEPVGFWVHRATIHFLRKGKVNLKSQKLILAACHFLPEEEKVDEIGLVARDESQLTRQMLECAMTNNDFEMLCDVLLHLNKRTIATAEEYLREIQPPPIPSATTDNDEPENGDDTQSQDVLDEDEFPKEPPPSSEAPSIPSHKSAMIFLLSGTIHKVKESWLEAMKDYQNALLTCPEMMHRVMPVCSKLAEDFRFHEGVLSQVHDECLQLKNCLMKEEYPNIDNFSSNKRQSLILTDITPLDYGYKDAVSRIQQDPQNTPAPPPPDDQEQEAPPPPPANTPMVTLDKNEEAIQSGQKEGQIDHLSAALAYVDLLKALPLNLQCGPLVMASSNFLLAMGGVTDIGTLYAYRNAIMLMAENLLRVDKKFQQSIQYSLTHKHMLSILLSAHEILSKALHLAKKTREEENGKENEDDNREDAKSNKKHLIRQSDAHLISKFFRNVVNFPKVDPLANMPTFNCSDLVYVETVGNSFLSRFCADKVRQKHQSPMIPKHLHAYTHFVEVWKGRSTLSDFPQARVKAMEELVALRGWSMGNVEKKMACPFLLLQDGYSPPLQCLLQLRDPKRSYRNIDGFHIDYGNGTVELLFSLDSITPADTLFDHDDIRDVLRLTRSGLDRVVFSLETPDSGLLTSHPFKEARIKIPGQNKPENQQQQQKIWSQIPEYIQATLSRVSMLLCYLTSGLEFSAQMPFWMKRTDEGLLSRLDEHLQHLARPITWRKAERRGNNEKSPLGIDSDSTSKFWLNMVEVFEEIEELEEEDCYDNTSSAILTQSRELTYRIGQIRTELRPNTLIMTIDSKRKKEILSPEAEFCRDFTRNFQDFSRAYPEFARLEELVKISIVCSKLKQILAENRAMIKELEMKPEKLENEKLKNVSRVCTAIENFLEMRNIEEEPNSNTCNFFPATFCHNMDPDVYDVVAGIELDPVVTYGPVPSSTKSIRVPLNRIVGGAENEFVELKDSPLVDQQSEEVEIGLQEEENEDAEESELEFSEEDENDNDGAFKDPSISNLSAVPEEETEDSEEEEEEISEYEDSEIEEDDPIDMAKTEERRLVRSTEEDTSECKAGLEESEEEEESSVAASLESEEEEPEIEKNVEMPEEQLEKDGGESEYEEESSCMDEDEEGGAEDENSNFIKESDDDEPSCYADNGNDDQSSLHHDKCEMINQENIVPKIEEQLESEESEYEDDENGDQESRPEKEEEKSAPYSFHVVASSEESSEEDVEDEEKVVPALTIRICKHALHKPNEKQNAIEEVSNDKSENDLDEYESAEEDDSAAESIEEEEEEIAPEESEDYEKVHAEDFENLETKKRSFFSRRGKENVLVKICNETKVAKDSDELSGDDGTKLC